jgi:hypothetical protein
MLRGNRARAKLQPINVAKRRALEEEYIRDYRPATQDSRGMCSRKAKIDELLDRFVDGSARHERLEAISRRLATQLEAGRPPAHNQKEAFSKLTDDELIDRTIVLVRRALTLRGRPENAKRLDAAASSPIISTVDYPAVDARARAPTPASLPAPEPQAARVPTCSYCRKSYDQCASIKESDLELWRTYHWSDPNEIDRRATEATKVMMHQIGKRSPWL